MSQIWKEMKGIRESGGSKLILDFGKHDRQNIIPVPVIHLIIGGCKGNDILCESKGGYSLNMNVLCCDCNISPADGNNEYISSNLKCDYITANNIFG